MIWPLSDDTNTVLLLCAWLGGEDVYLPLEIQEYNTLEQWLLQNGYRPGNLIQQSCAEAAAQATGLGSDRLTALLSRNITMGFYLEGWQRKDYWIIGRGDVHYPERVRQFLQESAPPVLFGMGDSQLLDQSATAVIGPDQVMESANQHAREIAELCARHDRTAIAAGKQTLSAAVVESGLLSGGSVIWVIQGPVFGESLRKLFRRAKAAGKFLMLSGRSPADRRPLPQEPEVGRIAVALCDSVMYVDGTELSGDRYCMEDAVYRVLEQRNCFVRSFGQATAAAERLTHGGANPWIEVEMAIHEGLFEDRAEIIQGELLEDDHPDHEIEPAYLEIPAPSKDLTSIEETEDEDCETEKMAIVEEKAASGSGKLQQEGIQLDLFEKIPGNDRKDEEGVNTGSSKKEGADDSDNSSRESSEEYGIQGSLF